MRGVIYARYSSEASIADVGDERREVGRAVGEVADKDGIDGRTVQISVRTFRRLDGRGRAYRRPVDS
jgi:hypothetical protein